MSALRVEVMYKATGSLLLAIVSILFSPQVRAQQISTETPQGILAAQIRTQGFACEKPLGAKQNKKQNAGAIGALNFFLGWTLVGWVVALVWAISKDVNVTQPSPMPSLTASAQKKCPDCAEMVLAEAKKCRFCGHDFAHAH